MVYTPIESNNWYLLSFVPLKGVNNKSDSLLQYTLFICAILTVIFAGLCVTIAVIFNNNKKKLEKISYVDSVTRDNTLPKFINIAKNNLISFPSCQFALIYTNFEKFKVLNDELGRETCDEILRTFSYFISASLSEKECIGRIYADNFCLLLEYTDDTALVDLFKKWRSYAEIYNKEHGLLWAIPCTEFGIFVIENTSLDFAQMIDRANLALKESLHNIDSKLHYAFYNDDVRRKLYGEDGVLWKVEMTGENLLNTIEYAIPVDNNLTGWFYYFSGLNITFDPTIHQGKRIKKITTSDGQKIDPDKIYSIAVMDYTVPEKFMISCEKTEITINNILTKHILNAKEISPRNDNRFVIP